MSILGNHFPEVLDQLNGIDDEGAGAAVCECSPEGNDVGAMCPLCRAQYDAYRALVDSQEACGQQFADGPLPANMPF